MIGFTLFVVELTTSAMVKTKQRVGSKTRPIKEVRDNNIESYEIDSLPP